MKGQRQRYSYFFNNFPGRLDRDKDKDIDINNPIKLLEYVIPPTAPPV